MFHFMGLMIFAIAAVPKKTEFIFRNAGYFFKHIIFGVIVQIGQGKLIIAISHEETGDGAGETAETVTDRVFDRIFRFLCLGFLYSAHQFNGLALHDILDILVDALVETFFILLHPGFKVLQHLFLIFRSFRFPDF